MAKCAKLTAKYSDGSAHGELPGIWYGLLSLVAIFGTVTWILDRFSDKFGAKKDICILWNYIYDIPALRDIYH